MKILFTGGTGNISPASVYQKPLAHPVIPDLTDAAFDLLLLRSLDTQPFQRITL